MDDATTILFGLPGMSVREVDVDEAGARTVHVVTADPGAAACPVCRVISALVRQYQVTRPKDLPYGEAPLAVRWTKSSTGVASGCAPGRRSPSRSARCCPGRG